MPGDEREKSGGTDPGRFQPGRATDERDAAMAEGEKMIHRLGDTKHVIHLYVADALSDFADVEKDQRYLSAGKLVDKCPVDFRRHDGDSVHLPLDHPTHQERHPRSVVIGGSHQYVVPVLMSAVL